MLLFSDPYLGSAILLGHRLWKYNRALYCLNVFLFENCNVILIATQIFRVLQLTRNDRWAAQSDEKAFFLHLSSMAFAAQADSKYTVKLTACAKT